MRSGFLFLMIAGAMATAWAASSALKENPGIDTELTTASIAPRATGVYRLTSVDIGLSCKISTGDKVSRGLSKLNVDPACESIMPGMSRVRYWREKADGSVEFTGEGGDTLAAFSVGDGVDYESFRPRQPLLSISSGG